MDTKRLKTGIVLEGGGMRGLYTNGVLDKLMDEGIRADYVIGVSAGAGNGISYVSGQRGRGGRVNLDYIGDPRYIGVRNLLRTRSVFGMEFIFNTIPHRLDPFDFDAFQASPCEFVAGATDVLTGRPVYFGKEHLNRDTTVLRASASLPVFSPPVEYQGRLYLDGGTSDPIPVRKALEDGCTRLLVVLTRPRDYKKPPEKHRAIYARLFRKYPKMVSLMDNRHRIYNHTLAFIRKLEERGKAVVIAPSAPIGIGRFERDPQKLSALYELGMRDAGDKLSAVRTLFCP